MRPNRGGLGGGISGRGGLAARNRPNKSTRMSVSKRLATADGDIDPYGPKFQKIKECKIEQLNGCCERCGVGGARHLDHVIPVAQGGRTIYINMELLCSKCHQKKLGKANRQGSKLLKGAESYNAKRRRNSHESTKTGQRESWRDLE